MDNESFRIAESLHNSGCIKFGDFVLKSGAKSPYYVDLACLLSSPQDLCIVAEVAASRIRQLRESERIDKLATIELKGALILPSVACKTGLPCLVVRKEDKAYGALGRIAGSNVTKDDHIMFFDDVVSEGLSKLEGLKPLEELGAKVKHIMVVIDREQGGRESLEKLGYSVHSLAKISSLVRCLFESKHIPKYQSDSVLAYIRER